MFLLIHLLFPKSVHFGHNGSICNLLWLLQYYYGTNLTSITACRSIHIGWNFRKWTFISNVQCVINEGRRQIQQKVPAVMLLSRIPPLIWMKHSPADCLLLVLSLAPVPLINSWLSSVTNVSLPSSSPGEEGGVFNVQFVLWIDVRWHRLTLPCTVRNIPLPTRFTRFPSTYSTHHNENWLTDVVLWLWWTKTEGEEDASPRRKKRWKNSRGDICVSQTIPFLKLDF